MFFRSMNLFLYIIESELEFASRQIRTPSQIFDFLVLFCREFNADSYETISKNFGYVLAEI